MPMHDCSRKAMQITVNSLCTPMYTRLVAIGLLKGPAAFAWTDSRSVESIGMEECKNT
jgi:hypothetical protein